jgi:hypothetical protein
MATNRSLHVLNTETEVAVLHVQVENIEHKVGEIKEDVKELRQVIEGHAEETQKTLKEMREASSNAHKSMAEKINSLEKWRWMMMGAGIVLGTLGYDTIAKLLK